MEMIRKGIQFHSLSSSECVCLKQDSPGRVVSSNDLSNDQRYGAENRLQIGKKSSEGK